MIFLPLDSYFDLYVWTNHHSQSALQLHEEAVPIGSNWRREGGVFKLFPVQFSRTRVFCLLPLPFICLSYSSIKLTSILGSVLTD